MLSKSLFHQLDSRVDDILAGYFNNEARLMRIAAFNQLTSLF